MKDLRDITIRELAKLIDPKGLERALSYHYRHLKVPKGYGKKMLDRLANSPKKAPKNPKERIEVYAGNTDWETKGEPLDEHYGVHTIELGTMESWGKPKAWSMSFRPWNVIANIKVHNDTLDSHRVTDILAHVVYEITWYGNEKQMAKTGKGILGSVKKAIKNIEKSKKNGKGNKKLHN